MGLFYSRREKNYEENASFVFNFFMNMEICYKFPSNKVYLEHTINL